MDATRDYHTKWDRSEKEGQIPYDITYMFNQNMAQMSPSAEQKQMPGYGEKTCGCQGSEWDGLGFWS